MPRHPTSFRPSVSAPPSSRHRRRAEARRQRHLESLAADLDDDGLAWTGVLAGFCCAGEGGDLVVEVGLDPAGEDREGLGGERRITDDRTMERQGRGHAVDDELVQCTARARQCLGSGLAGDDQLGQQRVERTTDDGVRLDAGVDSDAGAGRLAVGGDGAGRRQEVASRILAVDAELEGVTTGFGVFGEAQNLALGNAELLADEVEAARLLGDGVLDLQPGVDLEEADDAVAADEELDRARAGVAGLAADRLGAVVDAGALLVGEERRGASSTSFWLRRCNEQSRVPTTTTLPCVSASTCASTCRDRSR